MMEYQVPNEPEEEPKIKPEDEKKIQWVVQLFGFIKNLQHEIHKKERQKRYIAIFVSGCITYFIIKILTHVTSWAESLPLVMFSAFISLCLHYIIDNIERSWNRVLSLKKFHQQLQTLEKERIKLDIKEEDLDFGPYGDEKEEGK